MFTEINVLKTAKYFHVFILVMYKKKLHHVSLKVHTKEEKKVSGSLNNIFTFIVCLSYNCY